MVLWVIAGLLVLILLALVAILMEVNAQVGHSRLLFVRLMASLETTLRRLLKDPSP